MAAAALLVRWALPATPHQDVRRPNVILILTDDQGHGDLGVHGNPRIRTPRLDALARESARLDRFHVSPVCSPTRASLLTGRYSYRTGVVDTYLGRSLLRPDEVTLAEALAGAGYRTGIFGKWHLGDNAPLRPMDRGFQESLVLKGGGIGQPSDLPGGESYFDPVLLEDGRPVKLRGYVSDVLTARAMRFVEKHREQPFFAYLAYNAPHVPLEVPQEQLALYREIEDPVTARVYAMVSSIDDNVGRLLDRLDALDLARDTVVIFLTDNGPQQVRYTSGLRGRKGTVYDGGIRVPCFLRWPGRFPAGREIDRIAAHIDIFPTVLAACGVPVPEGARLDGRSLLPLLLGRRVDWPDRTLFFQWHRGDEPQLHRSFAARSQRWKLVQPLGAGPGPFAGLPRFELYDMELDPFERDDLAGRHPEVAADLLGRYRSWFGDVTAGGFSPPRIHLGGTREDPVVLTRQDWRGPRAGWKPEDRGHWEVQFTRAGSYRFTLRFAQARADSARLMVGGKTLEAPIAGGAVEHAFGPLGLDPGPNRLEAWTASGEATAGVLSLEVDRVE